MTAVWERLLELWRDHAVPLTTLVVAVGVTVAIHTVVYFVARRVQRRREAEGELGQPSRALVARTRGPARWGAVLLALQLALPATEGELLAKDALELCRHVVSLALIGSVTWLLIRAMSTVDDVIMARYPTDVADNLRARRVHTQTRVLTRTAMILVVVLGLAAMLMTFPRVRQVGASLLAAGGLAGIVVGLAARPTIANLIAGLQIAITDPIRSDDVLTVEGEWGRVEEVTATYVVIRIWDERRLIVPLNHFLEQPFQNWTRVSAELLGTVLLHVDFRTPVESLRAALKRILEEEESERWDGRVQGLQVTNASDRSLELRALVSASDSSALWDLRCAVREKLIAFLQARYPEHLPRLRVEGPAPDPARAGS